MKTFRPFFVIVPFLLMVGLACALGSGGAQPTPQNQPTAGRATPKAHATTRGKGSPTAGQPTAKAHATARGKGSPTVGRLTPKAHATARGKGSPTAVRPTAKASATRQNTNLLTATPNAQSLAKDFFTDTFDGNLDNYSVENRKKGSDEGKMKVAIQDGAMVFDLQASNLWVYVTYEPFKYTDVKISMTVENRGKNTNNVTLFCRQSSKGWYEFSLANNGSYWIYAYDASAKIYKTLFNDRSTAAKAGKETNVYAASCVGNQLTLSINGTEVKTIGDSKYKFREGTVGFGVSTFSTIPILVNVAEFTISQP